MLFVLVANTAGAQFRQASIGINGLTCSQCSRSVEMQLRKLNFISDVDMDLEHKNGVLHFKTNSKVDMKAIAGAVKDAGFSVRYLKADIDMDQVTPAENGACFKIRGDVYYLLAPLATHTSKVTFRFMDYASKKELQAYALPDKTTAACKGNRVYHIVAEP
ncbi:heavy-metal-associated domain-containing protein [Taibaiella chishuiensis]|uniref:heavy-metal-associated domain-containing protein n=1 Tax=Taibaiella chishuiensis TaxID=1434707 RepID=UPI0015E7064F|nr:heavy metal-associated domain-containing protein [Taibaiella chishuiensis]